MPPGRSPAPALGSVADGPVAAAGRAGPPQPSRAGGLAIAGALLVTLTLGAGMRWILAGRWMPGWDFGHLRNAHSHLGYFGLVMPLVWLAWRGAGVALPGRRTLWLYAAAVILTLVGFLSGGYGPAAIVGSSLVAAIWLLPAWRLRGQLRRWDRPLGAALPGLLAALACVPAIGLLLRSDPSRGQALVTTFLTLLLLGVALPTALDAGRLPARGVELAPAAMLGAAALGIWPAWPARIGLAWLALLVARSVWSGAVNPRLRVAWTTVALALLVLASGRLATTRPVLIGLIHFVLLGPVLASLSPAWLRRQPAEWAWWLELLAVALLAGSLLAQGLGAAAWSLDASATGGSLVLAWWALVLAWQPLGGAAEQRWRR